MVSADSSWRRLRQSLRQMLQAMSSPKSLFLLALVAFLYAPFALKFGWEYRRISNYDLPSFYAASVQVFEHRGSPYERERLESLMGPDTYVHPYLYPPPSLLLFAPLIAMEYPTAQDLFLVMNHLVILALIWLIPNRLLRSPSQPDHTLVFAFTALYLLTSWPTILTLNRGQVNLLLTLFIVGFWILARAQRPLLASFFLALAILLKTYPILIVLLLLVAGRRRESAYTLAWLALASLIALLIVPPAAWSDWFLHVLPGGGYASIPEGLFSPAVPWNQSLNGYFARLFMDDPGASSVFLSNSSARLFTYGVAGLVGALSALATWRGARARGDGLDSALLLALPAIFLVAPFSWEHHLAYLTPSILILVTARTGFSRGRSLLFHGLALAAGVSISLPVGVAYKLYAVLSLWCLCVLAASSPQVALDPAESPVAVPGTRSEP